MHRATTVALVAAAFCSGLFSAPLLGQKGKPVFTVEQIHALPPNEAGTSLLDTALQLAGDGSWERIAVGRAWYLGGDKTKGQEIFDQVTGGKKVAGSDWFRIGRVYAEAGEWDKASQAFDKALSIDKDDDSGLNEYGALANVYKDRARAEDLFERAMKKNPREFWHWVSAGGSYLGVRPPQ